MGGSERSLHPAASLAWLNPPFGVSCVLLTPLFGMSCVLVTPQKDKTKWIEEKIQDVTQSPKQLFEDDKRENPGENMKQRAQQDKQVRE